MPEPVVEVKKSVTYPIEVIYCGKCGLLPEYCEFAGKQNDFDECKKWLKEALPDLYNRMYETIEEESKDEEGGAKKKQKKKVKFVDPKDK